MATTSRYSKSLPKDDIKRLSKEVTKKLVRGDFKAGRVKDPTAPISAKHEKTVKNMVKEFMDRALKKKEEREKEKASRNGTLANVDIMVSVETESPETPRVGSDTRPSSTMGLDSIAPEVSPANSSGGDLKRKREEDGGVASPKKIRSDSQGAPPPPPPPMEEMAVDAEASTLTPMDDDPISVHSTSDNSVNGLRPKTLDGLGSPTQLATPPTKEHHEYHGQSLATRRS